MKPKSTLIHSSTLTGCARVLLEFVTSHRKILLGLGGVAILSMSGCAVDGGGGYYPYSGAYYGGYGPYDGGFLVGGVYHGGHYGGHHFYGSSFGRNGFSGGGRGGGGHGGGGHRR